MSPSNGPGLEQLWKIGLGMKGFLDSEPGSCGYQSNLFFILDQKSSFFVFFFFKRESYLFISGGRDRERKKERESSK